MNEKAMTPVDEFRFVAKKAEADAEAMGGFPGSGYPAHVATVGLRGIMFLEARIKALEKETRALRANVSKSVLRRLEGQGVLRDEEDG